MIIDKPTIEDFSFSPHNHLNNENGGKISINSLSEFEQSLSFDDNQIIVYGYGYGYDGLTNVNALDYFSSLGFLKEVESANPTATVDGTATNGSALTFLRSDSAPALANPFTSNGDQLFRGDLVMDGSTGDTGIAITGTGQFNSLSFGSSVGAYPHIGRFSGTGTLLNLLFSGSPGGEFRLSTISSSTLYTGIEQRSGSFAIWRQRIYGESSTATRYGLPLARAMLLSNSSDLSGTTGASVFLSSTGTGNIYMGNSSALAMSIDGTTQDITIEQDLTVKGDTYLGTATSNVHTITGDVSINGDLTLLQYGSASGLKLTTTGRGIYATSATGSIVFSRGSSSSHSVSTDGPGTGASDFAAFYIGGSASTSSLSLRRWGSSASGVLISGVTRADTRDIYSQDGNLLLYTGTAKGIYLATNGTLGLIIDGTTQDITIEQNLLTKVNSTVNGALKLPTGSSSTGIDFGASPATDTPRLYSETGGLNLLFNRNGSAFLKIANGNAGVSALSQIHLSAQANDTYLTAHGNGSSATIFGLSAVGYLDINNSASGGGVSIRTQSMAPLKFGTNGILAMTIDGTTQDVSIEGGIFVGSNDVKLYRSDTSTLTSTAILKITENTGRLLELLADGGSSQLLIQTSSASNTPVLEFQTTSGTLASPTSTASGRTLGSINFRGYTTSEYSSVLIQAIQNASGSGSNIPGRLEIKCNNGSSTTTQLTVFPDSVDVAGDFVVDGDATLGGATSNTHSVLGSVTIDHGSTAAGLSLISSTTNLFYIRPYSNTAAVYAGVVCARARGTFASPLTTADNDTLAQFIAQGYSSSYRTMGRIIFYQRSSFSGTNADCEVVFTANSASSGEQQVIAYENNYINLKKAYCAEPTASNASATITPTTSYVEWGASVVANATLSDPNISDGVMPGQRLTIVNVSSSYLLTFTDGQNVQLPSATITLATNDSIDFVWSSTLGDWICVSYSNN